MAPLTGLRQFLGDRARAGESLSRHTTSRIGGPADLLVEAASADDLRDLVLEARRRNVPVFVLGGGANVLVSDAGMHGLTIVNKARRLEFLDGGRVRAESGVVLPTLARECIARSLSGLEWAVGVPGTVGGAIVGNAGAHGRDTASDVKRAWILGPDSRVREWTVDELEFEYRSSRIKQEARSRMREPGADTRYALRDTRYVVLAAEFRLARGDRADLERRAAEFNDYRRRTQPPGASMGSMFKNPSGDAAGRLIDAAGLKRLRVGNAEISSVHANFFVNLGGATARDVMALIERARRTVREQFDVELELEIELVGDWGNG
ncbi:MAG TPA: UDP-N-acetylmuramate dehydrogenase [Anaerolineae bacterium]|nr:UDP-N-acetylmuramate dehydrogenase [Anaerolineae bacterium]